MRLFIEDTLFHAAGAPLPLDLPHARACDALATGEPARPPMAGTVYGVLHNDPAALAAMGDRVLAPPYKAAPKAPVLYIKPRNTHLGHGRAIPLPPGAEAVQVGAALGAVIGRTACRVAPGDALDYVAGYTVVNDVTLPHREFYRPSLRLRVRDGFCPMGPWVRAARQVGNPDALDLRVWIDGALRLRSSTRGFLRPLPQLIADVTDFMTLQPGDVLLTGLPWPGDFDGPLAHDGQRVAIEIENVGRLENPVVRASVQGGSA
ncbi:fumarylacetoacetate hydrolase family protein [Pigmentiphaga sp. NML030171]|uniref:fumarylacetoacetate hydrolase family protein n=1 Tax=Pigmentiphaga sp. NML030171 TaxID=2008676 RepID=UPI0015958391|nr:fumarylacetoacetate hydrolase family protein [Pigmentiphaga sp. NML030171]